MGSRESGVGSRVWGKFGTLAPIAFCLLPLAYSCSLLPIPCSLFPVPYSYTIELSFHREVFMGKEEELLKHWRELAPEKQQKVLEFVELLKSESETTPPQSDFVPKTPLAQKLWEIRQRAIAAGLRLLNEEDIELELAARRGGWSDS
ncbi:MULTISPECIES: hypothetical protein [unclassified Moorena]|uniref:hypothetical protein n=1 Tax=unclassified Moorena TaxID=2683338 RepID=UPI0025FECC0C|nr:MULTISPECIES: hypothetical protein [unclassified Moorena]